MKRIILGVSGASGAVLAERLVKALKSQDVELHMIVSDAAKRTWELEAGRPIEDLTKAADVLYAPADMAAAISSGSYRTDGMIVAPCSMKTLAGIVSGYTDQLLLRAADVCMKERRRVVLCPREMPLSLLHLRNLSAAAELGCIILPPMLSFYSGQQTVEQQLDHIIGKILMQFDLDYPQFHPWNGPEAVL